MGKKGTKEEKGKKEKIYTKFWSVLRLEFVTEHGRINLGGLILITVFGIIYTASDVFHHIISATEDIIKTITLGEDISHPYEMNDLFTVIIPIGILFVLCLLYLYIHECKKKDNKTLNENIDDK